MQIKSNFWEVVSEGNLLIMFSNIFVFIVIEIVFFWFVLSAGIDGVVKDKTGILIEFLEEFPEIREQAFEYVNSYEVKDNALIARFQKRQRDKRNFCLMKERLFPVLYTLAIVIFLVFASMILRKVPFSRPQRYLLLFVLGAFSTEIIYYFVVVDRWNIISDAKVASSMSDALFDISPNLELLQNIPPKSQYPTHQYPSLF